MSIPQLLLITGDPYRCEEALLERSRAILSVDRTCERHVIFGDEADAESMDCEFQSIALFSLGRHFVLRRIDRVRRPKLWAETLAKDLPEGTYITAIAADLKATHPVHKACISRNAVSHLPSPQRRAIPAAAKDIFGKAGLRLDPRAAILLAERTGGDLLAISQEAKKLSAYGPDGVIDEKIIQRVVSSASEVSVYPFFDRLGERDLPSALRALDEVRDDPGRILGGALRHLSRLVMIRLLIDQRVPSKRISSLVGAPDWLLRRLLGQAKRFRIQELTAALDAGIHYDTEIKSGGIHALDALLSFLFAVVSTPSRSPKPSRG